MARQARQAGARSATRQGRQAATFGRLPEMHSFPAGLTEADRSPASFHEGFLGWGFFPLDFVMLSEVR